MPIATLSNIEKTFGRRVIFDHLNFSIDRGERVGMIGDNGSGKTTLFKTLTGVIVADSGTVAIAKGAKIGHLSQDPTFDATNTVVDEAELAFAQLHALSHKMRDLEHEMAHVTGDALDKVLNRYQDVQHEFEIAGGYAWRHRLEATLLGVGLPEAMWEQSVSTLSGGQRSRLALAKLLISEPDILLLDEPTNHLDLAAIDWLENYLKDFSGAVLIISHDRYLLDRLATRIVWLTNSIIKSYPGNFSSFQEQRAMQELAQTRAYEEQQADIAKQAEFVRRFGAGQRAREAKGREKRLNRLLKSDAMIEQVRDTAKINLQISTDQRAGDRVLKVTELSKSYDNRQLWHDLRFQVDRGERIGIIGPNGSGKTTLLEVLLGRRDADGGEVRWGSNLSLGYYDQQLHDFDPEATVSEEVRGDRDVKDQDLRNVLALMLFRGETVDKPIGQLSGGERARVAMAQLLIDKPNVLVLDEPTNHLDIASCEALEGALSGFDGTILCVSHDRYFLDKVVQRMLVLQPPDLIDFDGNYSKWAAKQASGGAKASGGKPGGATKKPPAPAKSGNGAKQTSGEKLAVAGHASSGVKTNPSSQPGKTATKPAKANPFARPHGRLTTQQLEAQIATTESQIAALQQELGHYRGNTDPGGHQSKKREYESLARVLKELEEEYYAR